MAKITINGITLDPSVNAPALSAAKLMAKDAAASNYILIQASAPLTADQRGLLQQWGVQLQEYIPENTYLGYYLAEDLTKLRALPFITWVNTYMQGFKIAPSLGAKPNAANTTSLLENTMNTERPFSDQPRLVDVVFHRGVEPNAVRHKVAAAARLDPADLQVGGHKIRLTVPLKYLKELAAIDEVRHIEEVVQRKLHCTIARSIIRADLEQYGSPLSGLGQIVAVADTGFDKGSVQDVHPSFTRRVIKLHALGRPNNANDPHGHGTHIAGIVLGDGHSQVLGMPIKGVAPGARLIFQSILDSRGGLGGIPDDLESLFWQPYQEGARVHTNSWGGTVGDSRYDTQAFEVDQFVWQHRDMSICFSAGNEGQDVHASGRVTSGTITPPATAKNCITVGASENFRPGIELTYGKGWPDTFPGEPFFSDKVANNHEGMVAFSSRGPTQDNRIKPDVVAPGTFILSSRSRAILSAKAGWQPSADPLFYFQGGTSFAVPFVAGCVAVIREFFVTALGLASPSAALIKAMLINGARDLSGQYIPSEAGAIPNTSEGFGIVDLVATIGPFNSNEQLLFKDEETLLESGQQESFSLQLKSFVALFKVTLVWTDPPGETLQNDLDLVVRTAVGEVHGNKIWGAQDFDRINNVEQIVLTLLPAGTVEIVVQAFRTALFSQNYALVVRVVYT